MVVHFFFIDINGIRIIFSHVLKKSGFCGKSVFRGEFFWIWMSVHVNGRTTRQLPIAEVAMKRQVSSEKFVLKVHDRGRYKVIISFLVIVLGGTLLTVATIQDSSLIYGLGVIMLASVAIYMIIQSSRLNSPCSLQ